MSQKNNNEFVSSDYFEYNGFNENLDESNEVTFPYEKKTVFRRIMHKLLDDGKLYHSDSDEGNKTYEFDKVIKSIAINNKSASRITLKIYGPELKNGMVKINIPSNGSFSDSIKGGTKKIDIETNSKYDILFRN